MAACVACGNAGDNRDWVAREMMFGMRDTFRYSECGACGSLTLTTPPADLAPYYPRSYYAHTVPRRESALKRALWRLQADQVLGRPTVLGRALLRHYGPPRWTDWIQRAGVPKDAAILDVGCGNGWILRHLCAAGWHNLTGIDPYLERDVDWPDGMVLRKRTLDDTTGSYDFIMAHHSFEHMSDPGAALRRIAALLVPGGQALIRVPVADSEAWRTYRTDWVQLDPPRHLFVPTRAGMDHLARQAGLALEAVTYDSTGFQFWASEQYRRDIPLADAWRVDKDGCLSPAAERARYEERARALNATEGADQACFYLRQPNGISARTRR